MKKYLDFAKGDHLLAEKLYGQNLELSKSAYGALQMCEVVLRNAIDHKLKGWSVQNGASENWTLAPHRLIEAALGMEHDELTKAKVKARKALKGNLREPDHDDVIAQLSFGTWRFLLPGRRPHTAKDKLWEEAIESAFPNLSPRLTRDALTSWVVMAYDLRNRVAHHEPIFHTDLGGKRRAMKDAVDAVSREARGWFTGHDTLADSVRSFQWFCKENKIIISK